MNGETWSGANILDLPMTNGFDVADWGLAVSNGVPNVVRFANGNYVHRAFNGTVWQGGPPMPSAPPGVLTAFALTEFTSD